ncbi:MAG: ComEC/Rec2 family competence protein [Phycisphaerae bacterium]
MNPASGTVPDKDTQRRVARLAPLLPAAIGIAAGVALDNWIAPGAGAYTVLGIVAAVTLVWRPIRRHQPWLATVAAAIALGGIMHDNYDRRVSPDHIIRFVRQEPMIARVTGTVISAPRIYSRDDLFFARWKYNPEATRFLLASTAIEGGQGPIHVSGTISVKVLGRLDAVTAGDTVTIYGKLYRPLPPANPGQFDFAQWARRHGIRAGMSCRSTGAVTLERAAASRWRAWLDRFRVWAGAVLVGDSLTVGDDEATLLETMVLGRRRAVDRDLEKNFIRTGTTHFLSVSGAHLGVVAWFAWAVSRWFGGTRRRCAVFVAVVIVLYACLVDPRPPIFRAAIIGLTFCTGLILRRSTSNLNSIALAAIILLCIRPTMLFEPGFQMSFAGVLAICYLHRPLYNFFRWLLDRRTAQVDDLSPSLAHLPGWRGRLWRLYYAFCSVAAVSTAACLASTPIVTAHFGRIAPFGWLNSIVLFPFFSLTLFAGIAAVVAGAVTPILLPLMQQLAGVSASALLGVVQVLETVSPQLRGWSATLFQVVYIVIVLALVATLPIGATLLRWLRTNRNTAFQAAVAGVLLTVIVGAAVARSAQPRTESLRVTHLSVGPGTASVIEFPDGRVWLYDCGTRRNFDVGASTIVPFCRDRGIKRIDRVIISHPNVDHFDGVLSVIDGLPTGPVVVNHLFESFAWPGGPAEAVLHELGERKHPIETIQPPYAPVTIDGVKVETLWPAQAPIGEEAVNDSSTVMRLTYRGRSILLCGDIEDQAMAALLEHGDLHADVLVLPHHGSYEPHTAAFISAVNPSICIRSSNRRTSDTSKTLLDTLGGRTLYNTADDGAVTVILDGQSVSVQTHRQTTMLLPASTRRG